MIRMIVLEKGNSNKNFIGTLVQMWKSCNSFVFVLKIVAHFLRKYKLYGRITGELLGFTMRNSQDIIFIWTETYRDFQIYIIVPISSLFRKNLNRVIPAPLNITSLRNKFDILAKGTKRKVDVLMISETKIDETFPSRQFYIEVFTHLTDLIKTALGVYM